MPNGWDTTSNLGCALSKWNAPARSVILYEGAMSGGDVANPSGRENGGLPYTKASAASWGLEFVVNTQGGHGGGWFATGFLGGRVSTCPAAPYPNTYSSPETYTNNYQLPTGRHLDGSNYLMADGHVKWLKGENVSSGYWAAASTSIQDSPAGHAEGTAVTTHAVTFSPI